MPSSLSLNAETLTQGRPLDRPDGVRRALPFALGAALALALLLLRSGAEHAPTVAISAVLILLIGAVAWGVSWDRLPPVAQLVVPLLYFGVVALMRDVSGGASSPFLVAVLLPVAWLAFYGTLSQVGIGLAAEALLFLAPVVLVGAPEYPTSDLASATLWLLLTGILALVVNQLIRELERTTARSIQAADEVRRTEGITQTIIQQANDAYISIDAAGRVIDWNPMAERLFGWPAAEIVGVPLFETIIPERLRDAHDRGLRRRRMGTAEPGSAVINSRIEVPAIDRAGREFPIELTISRVDAPGRVAFSAFLHDISERRRTEHFLRAQHAVDGVLGRPGPVEATLMGLLEAVGTSMDWTSGTLWTPAPGGERLTCAGTWQMGGTDMREFRARTEAFRPARGEGLPGSAWDTGEAIWIEDFSAEAAFPRREAAEKHGLHGALAIPLRDGGELLAVLEFFSPFRQRRSPAALTMVHALGEQISAALVRRQADVEAQRMKDEFFALVSHELRTPLTSIMGYLELILDGNDPLPDQVRKRLGVVDRNASRLLRLVSDLLFVAQVEAGAFRLERRRTDLQVVARASIEALRPRAVEKDLTVVDETTGSTAEVDPDRLGQAIDNLLSNAIKFTNRGGTVTVRVVDRSDGVDIAVEDSGIGVPAADQPLLFDRFYRSSNAGSIKGMGLGLAITKAIVEGHGGQLGFESQEGQGTTFRIHLPGAVPGAHLESGTGLALQS